MERFEKILFVSQSGAVDGPSLERIFALARSGGASVTLAGVVEYSAADFGAIPQGVAPQQLLQLLADERRDQLERLCAAGCEERGCGAQWHPLSGDHPQGAARWP